MLSFLPRNHLHSDPAIIGSSKPFLSLVYRSALPVFVDGIGAFFLRFIDELDCVSACLIIVCLATWCLRYAGSSWWGDLGVAGARSLQVPIDL